MQVKARIGSVLVALARFAGRIRTADDFPVANTAVATPKRRLLPNSDWTVEKIRLARNAQLRGDFHEPVRLAEAMRTDDALFTAHTNRLAPQEAIETKLIPSPGVRGEAVQRNALLGVVVQRTVLSSIHSALIDHAIAVGYIERETSDDGTAIMFRLKVWPLEFVKWNPFTEQLETTTREGGFRIPIIHGDGFWVVFKKYDVLPWTQDACLLPAAMIFPMHTLGISDWASASRSHGQAKILGKLPTGVALQGKDDSGAVVLTPEAQGYLNMLQDIVSGDAGAGIAPFGSETDFLANGSTAWQVFAELIQNREKAAMRVYTGTDAALGSVGGAPGVDISTLFGVATTRIQGDFEVIEQGLNTGVYQPWTALNYGDSRLAPRFSYMLPDPDAESKSAEQAAKRTRLFDALDRMRKLNLTITQATVDALAADYGVVDVPQLGDDAATQLQIPDTLIGGLTLGREGRKAQGLPPFGDERDAMTLDEIAIYAKGRADAATAIAKAKVTGAVQLAVAQTPAPTATPVASNESSLALLGGPGSGPRPGDAHPDGGSSEGGDPSTSKSAARQAHFDTQAKTANNVAKAGGYSGTLHNFLNQDRAAVSKSERDGTPNATSDHMTQFLREAHAKGADYKGAVYRGTTPAELDQITKGGANTTTWSVSKDPEGAAHFAKKGGVLLVMPKDHGAIPVDGIEGSNTFNEALVPKGSKWVVAGERNANGVRVVTLAPHTEEKLSEDIPPHDDADIDAALSDPNPKIPAAGDGGNLELWGKE